MIDLTKLRAHACRHLRTKTMYLDDDDSWSQLAAAKGTATFWCNSTQGASGPDNKVVALETCCAAGRHCYRAPE